MNIKRNDFACIRTANAEDLPDLMNYIYKEWSSGHILARDIEFFKYEYKSGSRLNFILSINSYGNIDGMLGFIPSSATENCDVWTTMWKVSRDCTNPILGLQLLKYLKDQGYRTVMSLGININTIGIYRYLGYETGIMNHHFLLNQAIRSYNIAKIPEKELILTKVFELSTDVVLRVVCIDEVPIDFFIINASHFKPIKDFNYFKRRYFDHPIYKYRVYGIYFKQQLTTLLVTRIVAVAASAVIRIVDIIGDEYNLKYVTHFLHDVLVRENFEYLDLVSYGLEEEQLQKAGFTKLDLSSEETVIPNLFHPFIQENFAINFFVDSGISKNFRLFKADGDQDRPS